MAEKKQDLSDISIKKWEALAEADRKKWKAVMSEGFFGLGKKKSMENITEEGKAQKMDRDISKKNLQFMSGIWKQSKITAGATKIVSNATSKFMSHWKLLLGLGIFLMPKEFWSKLQDGMFRIWNYLKSLDWKQIKKTIFDVLEMAVKGLAKIVSVLADQIFGKKSTRAEFEKQKIAGPRKNLFGADETQKQFDARIASMGSIKDDKFTANKFQGGLLGDNTNLADTILGFGTLALLLNPTGTLILGFQALKLAFTGLSALSALFAPAAGGVGILATTKIFLQAFAMGGILSPLAIVAALSTAIMDGIGGYFKRKEWGTSGFGSFLGGMFAGNKGWLGMFANMGKWAVAGAAIGFPFMGIGAVPGALIGAAIGAIFNLFGGKRMAQAFDNLGRVLMTFIQPILDAFQKLWEHIDYYLVEPLWGWIKPFGPRLKKKIKPLSDWFEGFGKMLMNSIDPLFIFLKKIVNFDFLSFFPEKVKNFFGLGEKKPDTEPPSDNTFGGTSESRLKEKEQKEIANLKKEIAEDEKQIAGKDYRTSYGRSRESRLESNLARLTELTGVTQKRKQSQGAPPTAIPTTPSTPHTMGPSGFGINFAKGQTRESSWTGQTAMTKNKMATLASMFNGGLRVTSGFRTKESGNEAMLKSKSDFSKTYSEQTRKGITDFGTPGSDERKAAIAQMRLNGFQSKHEHGNAIDFSYPTGYSKATFPQLKSDILSVFPGADLIKEKDHLHMSFSDKALPNQSGKNLQDLQNQNSILSGMGGGGGGTTVIAPTTNNNSSQSTTAVLANPTAEDSWWRKIDRLLD